MKALIIYVLSLSITIVAYAQEKPAGIKQYFDTYFDYSPSIINTARHDSQLRGIGISFTDNTVNQTNLQSKISLQKSFLGPLKFKTKDTEPSEVFTFTGLSLTDKFRSIISANPAALEEAEKSYIYNGVGLAASVALVVFAVDNLITTLDQADQVSEGQFPDDDNDFNFVPLIVSSVVMASAYILGKSCITKSVKIYNNDLDTTKETGEVTEQRYYGGLHQRQPSDTMFRPIRPLPAKFLSLSVSLK